MTQKNYVLIDKEKLITEPFNAIKLFGSITALSKENLVLNGLEMNDTHLYRKLGKKKFYENEDYIIKRCDLIRSEQKK